MSKIEAAIPGGGILLNGQGLFPTTLLHFHRSWRSFRLGGRNDGMGWLVVMVIGKNCSYSSLAFPPSLVVIPYRIKPGMTNPLLASSSR